MDEGNGRGGLGVNPRHLWSLFWFLKRNQLAPNQSLYKHKFSVRVNRRQGWAGHAKPQEQHGGRGSRHAIAAKQTVRLL